MKTAEEDSTFIEDIRSAVTSTPNNSPERSTETVEVEQVEPGRSHQTEMPAEIESDHKKHSIDADVTHLHKSTNKLVSNSLFKFFNVDC